MAKLYFRYGAMNCGKSTSLLQVAHNYEERNQKVLVLKPIIDTKGEGLIVSRLGGNAIREADYLINSNDYVSEIIKDEENIDCLLIDEAQFLTVPQVDDLYYITKILNIPVICYGLRCDFSMQGFPGSTRLLLIADSLEEMKTICRCSKKATQNVRKINGIPTFTGNQVVIDNEEQIEYEAMCGECYLKLKYKPKRP